MKHIFGHSLHEAKALQYTFLENVKSSLLIAVYHMKHIFGQSLHEAKASQYNFWKM